MSLGLSRAYDRMPRHCLLQSLLRMQVPGDLSSLMMFIHDNATPVLSKHSLTTEVCLKQGVRQGCNLSPLLWVGFMLLIFDKVQGFLPANTLTGYADDFHLQWAIDHPSDLHQACGNIPHLLGETCVPSRLPIFTWDLGVKSR